MRLLVVFFVSFQTIGFSQDWVDSLKVARTAYKNKEYSKATRYYKSAQNLAPKEIDLSEEIAQSTYRNRDFDNAEKVFQQAASDKSNKIEKAKLQHNLGNTRMKKKDFSGAIEAYKDALRNNPNDEETLYNLSEALRQKKQQEQQKNNTNSEPDNKGNSTSNSTNQNSERDNKSSGNLPNRQADKMLDHLTKQEADTRRRIANGNNKNDSKTKTGKNW